MAFLPIKDAEPIPGYRLLDKLGIGGYGEVWRVTAPGGLTKAIKIVHGDLGGARAGQELKALERVKQVRHPFLLSLERFEIIDGQLFIVTELADCCLMDRYQECRAAGLKGIPRDELLGYVRDAADALDYMTETHGLQHLDIKPQNLLIVSGRIKVADFGLVKELVGTSVTATGGVTPIYATPEAFDGRVSRYSDQYSLAIVYQEMLTGVRPFPGITMMQLAAQHTSSPPMLQPLPPSDRQVIGRALAKVPEQRFPSCQKMAEALLTGRLTSTTNPVVTPELMARARKSGLMPLVKPPPTSPPTVSVCTPPAQAAEVAKPRTMVGPCQPAVLTGQPPAQAPANPRTVVESAPAQLTGPAPQAEAYRPTVPAPDANAPNDKVGLRPTLFLGVGGLACATLRHLRRRLHDHFGGLDRVPIVRMLLLDTNRDELRTARQGETGEALETTETLLVPLHLPDFYRPDSRKLLRWLDRRWLYNIPRSLLTEGLRPLGRLALVTNASAWLAQLRDSLSRITQPKALEATTAATGQSLRNPAPRVFVVASIAGGTGGGMLLGLAYAVRQVLGELGLPAHGLCGLLLHATSPKPADQQMARLNACATLAELQHFSQPDASYPGDPDMGLEAFAPSDAPFEDCYLVHLGDGLTQSAAVEATRGLADYLFLDTTPEAGAFLDRFRQQTRVPQSPTVADATIRAFGWTRLGTNKPGAMAHGARRTCRRLTKSWFELGDDRQNGQERTIDQEAERQAAAAGLEKQALVDSCGITIAKHLGESPEAYFERLSPPTEAVRHALAKVDLCVSGGPTLNPGGDTMGVPLSTLVQHNAGKYAAKVRTVLVDWLLDLIETPGQRLRAASRAAAWIEQSLSSLTESLRGDMALARQQADAYHQLLLTGKAESKGSGFRWLGRSRPAEESPSLSQKVAEYGCLRLQELALSSGLHIVGTIQETLSRFVQELTHCRQQLKQFADHFRTPPNVVEESASRQRSGEEASSIPPDLLCRFDETIQSHLLEPQGGLWSLFAGSGALQRSAVQTPQATAGSEPAGHAALSEEALRKELLTRAVSFLREALPEWNAAQSFLQAYRTAEQARPALLRQLAAATPRGQAEGVREQLLLGVPECPAKSGVLKLVTAAIPELPVSTVPSDEDLFLVREGAGYPMNEMIAALIGPQAPDLELLRKVLTRLDVSWSFLTLAPA